MKSRLNSVRDLQQNGLAPAGEDLAPVAAKYAIGITRTVLGTINKDNPEDPIALQYVPQSRERETRPDEHPDPIGDDAHTPVKGIVHRYPDRVLLKVTNACAVYCRYCFRREMTADAAQSLSAGELESALEYIREHKDIWEVILTGGDPLILSARNLGAVLDNLSRIDHVKVIRIHSRVPIADPGRITPGITKTLQRATPVYIILHINHENEITPESERAISALRASGCSLLSQSVLLKGVNDDAKILENLFRRLVMLHVKPYYLHHPDRAPGTSHFRVSVRRGQALMKELRGRVSGLCLPEYVLDIPGGFGKIPLTPCHLRALDEGTYTAEDYRGATHLYRDET